MAKTCGARESNSHLRPEANRRIAPPRPRSILVPSRAAAADPQRRLRTCSLSPRAGSWCCSSRRPGYRIRTRSVVGARGREGAAAFVGLSAAAALRPGAVYPDPPRAAGPAAPAPAAAVPSILPSDLAGVGARSRADATALVGFGAAAGRRPAARPSGSGRAPRHPHPPVRSSVADDCRSGPADGIVPSGAAAAEPQRRLRAVLPRR